MGIPPSMKEITYLGDVGLRDTTQLKMVCICMHGDVAAGPLSHVVYVVVQWRDNIAHSWMCICGGMVARRCCRPVEGEFRGQR